ncbi:hypothetical protein EYF80_007226 [Liparis tanakae]|uniref:Uncharacterized protein n=1 Tax=Liparis tanakae TaxID=230148 RepID=A0A4Z2IXB0_9TELE|nr:hypothetical protein EYF80_007226 [Liparis tanakae]
MLEGFKKNTRQSGRGQEQAMAWPTFTSPTLDALMSTMLALSTDHPGVLFLLCPASGFPVPPLHSSEPINMARASFSVLKDFLLCVATKAVQNHRRSLRVKIGEAFKNARGPGEVPESLRDLEAVCVASQERLRPVQGRRRDRAQASKAGDPHLVQHIIAESLTYSNITWARTAGLCPGAVCAIGAKARRSWHTVGMAAAPSSSKACLVSLLSPHGNHPSINIPPRYYVLMSACLFRLTLISPKVSEQRVKEH